MTRPDLPAARHLLAALDLDAARDVPPHIVRTGSRSDALADDLRALLAAWDAAATTPAVGERYVTEEGDAWTITKPLGDGYSVRGADGEERWMGRRAIARDLRAGTLRRLP